MQNAVAEALQAGSWDPDVVHARLVTLARNQSARDVEIGDGLLIAEEIELHVSCGYGSIFEYCERIFGWNGRHTFDRLRVARKLKTLLATRQALLDGRISWSMAREISRVAETPDIEAEWLEEAEGKTVREVEAAVSGRAPNESPKTPKKASEETRTVVLRFTAEQYARYLAAVLDEREQTGDSQMSEEAAVVSRMTNTARADAGRSASQIAFVQKVGTNDVFVQSPVGPLAVGPEVAERVMCDATVVPPTKDGQIVAQAAQSIPPAVRRQTIAESCGMCEAPGCRKCGEALHHGKFRSDGGDHDPKFLANVCWHHHDRIHGGFILLEGNRVDGWIWKHADGTPYGRSVTSPKLEGEAADAYQGFRRMGYKDPEARRAVIDAIAALGAEGKKASAEAILARGLRDAGKTAARSYTIKKDVGTAPTAHVGSDAPSIADVASGLKNLGLKDAESQARAACDALRGEGKAVTVEAALSAALRMRGASLLAREATAHVDSGLARARSVAPAPMDDAAPSATPDSIAHVGSEPIATGALVLPPLTESTLAAALAPIAHVGGELIATGALELPPLTEPLPETVLAPSAHVGNDPPATAHVGSAEARRALREWSAKIVREWRAMPRPPKLLVRRFVA